MKYILQKNSTDEVNIYSSTYFLQSRNMDTDVENKCLDTKEGKGQWNKSGDWDLYIYSTLYKTDNNEELLYSIGVGGKKRRYNLFVGHILRNR